MIVKFLPAQAVFTESHTDYHSQSDSKSVATQNWLTPNCINPCDKEEAVSGPDWLAKVREETTSPNDIILLSSIRKKSAVL